MSTNSDRRRDLRRALLDGVVDAQLGLQCGGSSARKNSTELVRISVASTLSQSRSSIVRSVGAPHDARSMALQPDQLH